MSEPSDTLKIGRREFGSRLLIGTGKYRDFAETRAAIEQTLPILRNLLSEHGLALTQTSVNGGGTDRARHHALCPTRRPAARRCLSYCAAGPNS